MICVVTIATVSQPSGIVNRKYTTSQQLYIVLYIVTITTVSQPSGRINLSIHIHCMICIVTIATVSQPSGIVNRKYTTSQQLYIVLYMLSL